MTFAFIVLSIAGLWAIVTNIISICSMLHMLLPPYETFADYPQFTKYYKLLVLIIGSIALNKREDVVNMYRSVDKDK